jgi:hypothetical protein
MSICEGQAQKSDGRTAAAPSKRQPYGRRAQRKQELSFCHELAATSRFLSFLR